MPRGRWFSRDVAYLHVLGFFFLHSGVCWGFGGLHIICYLFLQWDLNISQCFLFSSSKQITICLNVLLSFQLLGAFRSVVGHTWAALGTG